jgi:IstB-like ATP binding protein
MFAVEIYAAVRPFVFVAGKSRREAARVFGLSRDTIAKMGRYSAPTGYVRSKAPERPKLGPLVPVVDAGGQREDDIGCRLCGSRFREGSMTTAAPAASPAPPQALLAHHLRQLKLPTFLRDYEKLAAEAAREGLAHVRVVLRLAELELIDRERRMVERRIRAQPSVRRLRKLSCLRFPAVKSFDTFDFAAIPSLNKPLVLELARLANMSSPATTSSLSATVAPARRMPVWRSAGPGSFIS